jgi:hypothetical protein
MSPDTQLERSMDYFRKTATYANLGLAVWDAIKHITMPAFAALDVGFPEVVRGMGTLLFSPQEMSQFIYERSPMMESTRKRWEREIAATREKFESPIQSKAGEMISDMAFMMIHMIVNTARKMSWIAGYNDGMEKFAGHEPKAIEYADEIVQRMSGSFDPQDMPKIMRKTGLFRMLFTMFYTLGSNKFNRLWEAWRLGVEAKDKISYRWFADQFRAVWWLLLAGPLTLAMVKDMTGPKHQKFLRADTTAFLKDAAEAFPFIRDIASYAFNHQEQATPLSKVIQITGDLAGRPFESMAVKNEKDIEFFLDALGYGFGFPSRQALLSMKGVDDLIAGRTSNPFVLAIRPPAETDYGPGAGRLKLRMR